MSPILSLTVSFVGMLLALFAAVRSNTKELEHRLTALETKVDVFWKDVTIGAAAMLHRPHPEYARRDYLLESFTIGTLNGVEARELFDMLLPVRTSENPVFGERMAASILLRTLSREYGLDYDDTIE